ncbi:hypothetical protein ACQU0X_28850 [Pseudovibrio ascidiaceicola]|uniref:hypothetical protein n=1 Tax=Pseudovibrio ascidiaceicola TaxID=285279 RepID=UPI003D36427F
MTQPATNLDEFAKIDPEDLYSEEQIEALHKFIKQHDDNESELTEMKASHASRCGKVKERAKEQKSDLCDKYGINKKWLDAYLERRELGMKMDRILTEKDVVDQKGIYQMELQLDPDDEDDQNGDNDNAGASEEAA